MWVRSVIRRRQNRNRRRRSATDEDAPRLTDLAAGASPAAKKRVTIAAPP
jgi:hypothetical protein